MVKRIAVVGASGFIGRNLVKKFSDQSVQVLAIGRRELDLKSDGIDQAEHVACVKLLPEQYNEIPKIAVEKLGGLDAIVNCVAYGVIPSDRNPMKMVSLNVETPILLAEIAASVDASFVHLGSSAEYAQSNREVPLLETCASETQRLYGASKHAGTILSLLTSKQVEGRTAVLRLFNVYGSYEAEHRLFPSLTGNLARGNEVIMSEGSQVRDFIHVDDVTDAISCALQLLTDSPAGFAEVFNICSGKGLSVRGFAEAVCDGMDASRDLLKFGSIGLRPDDLPLLVGDNSKFRKASGWKPTISIRDAVMDFKV